ncbi:polysaccharide deacetylase family protein [Mariniphaga sediminis]|nr:polysaccharide deacetylase family protein [Mariniphaga sediminis]
MELSFYPYHLNIFSELKNMGKGRYRNLRTVFILFIIIITGGCKNTGKITEPGVILTFDDRNMLNWEKQIPLFAKYNAHVTFFVDRFDELTPEQLQALKRLKEAGHTIGCHGLRHRKAAEFCEKFSVEDYIVAEIEPAIKVMEEKGFPPMCFAYPNSNHSALTDSVLLNYFRYLRSGGIRIDDSSSNKEKAFVPVNDIRGKGRLDGVSFHPKSKNDDLVLQVKDAIKRLKENNELLVLYAHDIRNLGEEGPKNYITVEALDEILSYAHKYQIKFYSYEELP